MHISEELRGKRILFIAPAFFGYHIDIIEEMKARGAVVDWLPDRPFNSSLAKGVTRFTPSCVYPFSDILYRKILASFSAGRYDTVFVINGQTLSPLFLQYLRQCFSSARFVLYMWDSFKNRPGWSRFLDSFDSVLTFDSQDSLEYGIPLRPLFYGQGFAASASGFLEKYRLSFIGTAHSDRYQVVKKLRSSLHPDLPAFWYLYLQSRFVLSIYRVLKPSMRGASSSEFAFEPLTKNQVQSVFSKSLAVLDISHPRQTGLTMRTLEVLGSGKKLVTTNANVRAYDFFSTSNIAIIDRSSPHIPLDFLESSFQPLDPAVAYRYSISGWLDEVLDLA